jgi:predicted transcriptional regulator of viral defense system
MHYVPMLRTQRLQGYLSNFERHGGSMRMAEALRAGISRGKLYALRDAGLIEQVSRGYYRLSAMPAMSSPDLTLVAAHMPHGVLCLVSALAFHELTTQVPHAVDVALQRGARRPKLAFPPTNVYWFSGAAFHDGVEMHATDGAQLRVYDQEKTIVDCFRYRNKIGMDVVLEALRSWRQKRPGRFNVLMKYAQMRHVEKQLAPYLAVAP